MEAAGEAALEEFALPSVPVRERLRPVRSSRGFGDRCDRSSNDSRLCPRAIVAIRNTTAKETAMMDRAIKHLTDRNFTAGSSEPLYSIRRIESPLPLSTDDVKTTTAPLPSITWKYASIP
jgi:hypothetical protein